MNILSGILSSKTRAELFKIFFGTDDSELYLREIERRSGFTIETVRKEANFLESIGLLQKKVDGNRTYFSANKNHPLYPDIHSLVLKTSGLAEILHDALGVDKSIQFAFVFGSIAAGTEHPQSDIDLFIIGNLGLRTVSKLIKSPAQKISREINPHTMSMEEFLKRKKQQEHFITNVLESPKLFIIGTENEFARLGE